MRQAVGFHPQPSLSHQLLICCGWVRRATVTAILDHVHPAGPRPKWPCIYLHAVHICYHSQNFTPYRVYRAHGLTKKYGYAYNQACAISQAEVTAGAWSNPSISLRRPSIWTTANALKQLCKSNGNNWNVFKPAENAINLQNITLTTHVHAHSNKQNRQKPYS